MSFEGVLKETFDNIFCGKKLMNSNLIRDKELWGSWGIFNNTLRKLPANNSRNYKGDRAISTALFVTIGITANTISMLCSFSHDGKGINRTFKFPKDKVNLMPRIIWHDGEFTTSRASGFYLE